MTIEIEITRKIKVNVKHLQVNCDPRYWEDAQVDGVEDSEGTLIPCRFGDSWKPLINLENGIIENWQQGKTASVHYKVVDAGAYSLLNDDGEIILEKDGYVPSIMCPKGGGFGDYIIMDIDSDGKISDFRVDLSDFLP